MDLDSILFAESEGPGDAGTINIDVTGDVVLSGRYDNSSISTETEVSGRGGDLNIMADRLLIQDGSIIDSDTEGSGRSGDIFIQTREVSLTGTDDFGDGSIITVESDVNSTSAAKSGNISLVTDRLFISDNGGIEALTKGAGSAG